MLDLPSGVMIQEAELFQNQNVFLAVGPEVYVYEWLDSATQARDSFLAGQISEEEALKIIVIP